MKQRILLAVVGLCVLYGTAAANELDGASIHVEGEFPATGSKDANGPRATEHLYKDVKVGSTHVTFNILGEDKPLIVPIGQSAVRKTAHGCANLTGETYPVTFRGSAKISGTTLTIEESRTGEVTSRSCGWSVGTKTTTQNWQFDLSGGTCKFTFIGTNYFASNRVTVSNQRCKARPASDKKPTTAQAGTGLCGSIVSSGQTAVGFKGGDVNKTEYAKCILVENKCTYTINFQVQVAGLSFPSQGMAEPGKVGKICANKEGQSVSYIGMKKR